MRDKGPQIVWQTIRKVRDEDVHTFLRVGSQGTDNRLKSLFRRISFLEDNKSLVFLSKGIV